MFKPYPDKKAVPQRMARKRARRDVFMVNKRMTKLRRKAAQEARAARLEEVQDPVEE